MLHFVLGGHSEFVYFVDPRNTIIFIMTSTQAFIDTVFSQARTANGFLSKPVPPELLRKVYDAAKMGPTSMNTQPTRYVFLTTPQAKSRLLPSLMPGNVDKTKEAPVTVIVATDTRFYEFMPTVFPSNPNARGLFESSPTLAAATANRNGTLGSGYFIVAARAFGLDCGPMSGFDAAKLNEEFFPDGRWQANYLINLGFGDKSKLLDRNPRLTFEQATETH